ncbi:MAG: recombination protein RecR [Bacilli bacterium]|nr:recombination protein RecR [Bacilli bacterium]
MYPKSLKNLIESFKLLPGIGDKTAERLAFYLINEEEEKTTFFAESIKEAKEKIRKCSICNSITDQEICDICNNHLREKDLLCVVEDPKSIFLFEKVGTYNGEYHVIDGLISPLDGIDPDDIGLEKLVKRIQKGNYKEIIIAVKPSIEGETTALYIKKIIEDMKIKVTRIASGIPIGTDIEFIDSMTLERALTDRKEIE